MAYGHPRSRAVWRRERWSIGKPRAPNTPNLRPRAALQSVDTMWRQPARLRACCKHPGVRTSSQSGGLAQQRLEVKPQQSAKHTQRTMWHRTSNLCLERWGVAVLSPSANASAERLGVRWQALARHRFSQAGGRAGDAEYPTPRGSAVAFAGRIECCGRIPRDTQRKRCRRCRLEPCISVTAVPDAVALA